MSAATPLFTYAPRVSFFVPGKPTPKGRPKFARIGAGVRAITPAKTREYEAGVASVAAAAMQEAGHATPLDGALLVRVEVRVAPPVSWSKKRREQALVGGILPTKRPDLDNFVKAVMDGCDGVVWRDDAQVVALEAGKRFGEPVGVRVVVTTMAGSAAP